MRKDITGHVFGRWTVVAFARVSGRGKQYWKCQCVCGKFKEVESYTLISGRSKSCRKCSAADVGEILKTHGESRTNIYMLWLAMKTRCYNSKQNSTYKYHGALGVKVCDEWLHNFQEFRDYMGEKPTKHHTIDRINPFGNYKPGNVRWATQYEQMRNTRRNYKKFQ